jgi:hypothetical protein
MRFSTARYQKTTAGEVSEWAFFDQQLHQDASRSELTGRENDGWRDRQPPVTVR